MNLNSLTKCRAYLSNAIAEFSPVPIRDAGNLVSPPPPRLYAEIHLTSSKTNPTVDSRFKLILLVFAIPRSSDNFFEHIDVAYQFRRFLNGLYVIIPDVGCLTQEGLLTVQDLGFIDKAETIKKAKVLSDFILEY